MNHSTRVVVGNPRQLLEHPAGIILAVVQDHHNGDPIARSDSSPLT